MNMNIKAGSAEKKRMRNDDDAFIQNKPQCIPGKSPNFHLNNKDTSSEIKFGAGVETNAHRLECRMKQIQFGKNTIGYDNYCAAVPKNKRQGYNVHPRTPDPTDEVSKRAFDGRIKAWRRELHKWDNMESSLAIGVNNQQIQPKGAPIHKKTPTSSNNNSDDKDKSISANESKGDDNYNIRMKTGLTPIKSANTVRNIKTEHTTTTSKTKSLFDEYNHNCNEDNEQDELIEKKTAFCIGEGDDVEEPYLEEYDENDDVL